MSGCAWDGRAAFCAAIAVAALGCGVPPEERNLLLLTIDTLRADHLSVYGYPRPTSPHMDALASEGVRFTTGIAQRGGTWPSLTSILTSQYPRTHGVRTNGDQLMPGRRILSEVLRERGFVTAAFLTNMTTAPNRGFDVNGGYLLGRRDPAATRAALSWIEANRDRRFFVWLHLMGPHDPYDPSPDYAKRFDADGPGPAGRRENLERIFRGRIDIEPAELDHIVSLYDAEIAEVDERVAEVLERLRDLDLERRTVVALTSDHGEELYDHNYYFLHSWSIYDTVLHVPLILRLPGVLPAGAVVDGVVQSIDVAPTLLALLGVPAPESYEGRSLVPIIEASRESASDGAAISELGPHVYALRTDRWHYLYNPLGMTSPGAREADAGDKGVFRVESEELYDLVADPKEMRNVVAAHPDVAAHLRERLLAWLGKGGEGYRADALSDETHEELRALGYVD